jgi:ABC-type proline/glycine betaine transport system substrate-binding protein
MTAVDNSQAPAILATGSVFTALSVLAVILRFVARRIKRAQLGWDDWTILAALVMFILCEGLELTGEPYDAISFHRLLNRDSIW